MEVASLPARRETVYILNVLEYEKEQVEKMAKANRERHFYVILAGKTEGESDTFLQDSE